jgi:2-polyprenyl-6-methoxyphenol hydroxylase-like FAD-dependent oxidoreductase
VNTDVLIVGSGPSGLVLANLLARYGGALYNVEWTRKHPAEARATPLGDEPPPPVDELVTETPHRVLLDCKEA